MHRHVTNPEASKDGSIFEVRPCGHGVFQKPCTRANDGRVVRAERCAVESTRSVARKTGRTRDARHLRPLEDRKKDLGDAFSTLDFSGTRRNRTIKPLSEPVFDERPPVSGAWVRPGWFATKPHCRSRKLLRRLDRSRRWLRSLSVFHNNSFVKTDDSVSAFWGAEP